MNYKKPEIEEEKIIIEDIILLSNGGDADGNKDGIKVKPKDIWD